MGMYLRWSWRSLSHIPSFASLNSRSFSSLSSSLCSFSVFFVFLPFLYDSCSVCARTYQAPNNAVTICNRTENEMTTSSFLMNHKDVCPFGGGKEVACVHITQLCRSSQALQSSNCNSNSSRNGARTSSAQQAKQQQHARVQQHMSKYLDTIWDCTSAACPRLFEIPSPLPFTTAQKPHCINTTRSQENRQTQRVLTTYTSIIRVDLCRWCILSLLHTDIDDCIRVWTSCPYNCRHLPTYIMSF